MRKKQIVRKLHQILRVRLLLQKGIGGVAMEEKRLLIFRSGNGMCGVSVEDVSGIISHTHTGSILGNIDRSVPMQDKSIQFPDSDIDRKAGPNKSAIIINSNGVQLLIIADEIIQEKKLVSTELELDATLTSFPIWNFREKPDGSLKNNKLK